MLADLINNLARLTNTEAPLPGTFTALAEGTLLFSAPFLPDPNFARSVLLLAEHDDTGSIGFMLSRPMDAQLGDLVPALAAFDGPVYAGGPVEDNTLHFVHTLHNLPGARSIADGLYWAGDFDTLRQWVDAGIANDTNTLFFVGYSGWSEGQLQQEILDDTWLTLPATTADLWPGNGLSDAYQQLLGRHGTVLRLLSHMPPHPQWN